MRNSIKKTCPVLIIFALLFTAIITGIRGEAYGNRYQTNKNDISNLFNQEIEDRQGLEQFLEDSSREAQKRVEGKAAIDALGQKEGALQQKAAELDAVNANDLEARGREERVKEENTYFDKLEIDYSNPQVVNHKNDIDKIVDATNKLASKLLDGLRDIGIDCKQIKGDKELEPNYSLDIKKEDFKETIYERKVCEVLRNQYNCRDSLLLRCVKKGIAFGSWQNRTMVMTFVTIPERWWTVDRWENSYCACGRWRINPAYNQEIAIHIAGTIKARLDQVYVGHQNIVVIPRPNLSTNVDWSDCHEKWGEFYSDQRWAKVMFHYQYKPNYEICEQWSEDWNEVCKLQ